MSLFADFWWVLSFFAKTVAILLILGWPLLFLLRRRRKPLFKNRNLPAIGELFLSLGKLSFLIPFGGVAYRVFSLLKYDAVDFLSIKGKLAGPGFSTIIERLSLVDKEIKKSESTEFEDILEHDKHIRQLKKDLQDAVNDLSREHRILLERMILELELFGSLS